MTDILTERTINEATRVAESLHRGFAELLQLPLLKGQRASELVRMLGVGRMTCQRIVKLGDDLTPSAELLGEVPGISGLHGFLTALETTGLSGKDLEKSRAAVEAFAQLLTDLDMSQTRLAEALSLHFEATDPDRLLIRRSHLFDAAAAVTGQSADVTISMMALRPSEHQDFNIEQIAIRGYVGMRASGSAMPIRLPINMAYSDYRNVTSDEAARKPQGLIESFCSRPLPSIDSRVIKAEHLAHIINPEHIPTGEPFDCFAMQHSHWNVKDMGRHKAIWLYVDYPTRYCTFDLYVHRSIEELNKASGDCHLWGTSLLAPPEDLWMTRFADQMHFSSLGPGTDRVESSAYARHKELTEHLFNEHEWPASEFIGFRCEMELPIWRSGLCLILEEQ